MTSLNLPRDGGPQRSWHRGPCRQDLATFPDLSHPPGSCKVTREELLWTCLHFSFAGQCCRPFREGRNKNSMPEELIPWIVLNKTLLSSSLLLECAPHLGVYVKENGGGGIMNTLTQKRIRIHVVEASHAFCIGFCSLLVNGDCFKAPEPSMPPGPIGIRADPGGAACIPSGTDGLPIPGIPMFGGGIPPC